MPRSGDAPLLQTTLETGSEDGMNLVVFGGGFAATLVAFLVHSVFEVRCWPPCDMPLFACRPTNPELSAASCSG